MMRRIEMTQKEKIAMYMKTPKKKLAEMLCECNRILDMQRTSINPFIISQPSSTSLNDGYTYEATITSTASYPEDERKSKKTRKTNLEKKRSRVRKKNGGKR